MISQTSIYQAYEQAKYVIDTPTTLTGMIEMKMFEMKLKQKDLAKKLKVSLHQNFCNYEWQAAGKHRLFKSSSY